jgi:2,3-bisphosphoglycerate-independent phosphoglycerate mutase
MINLKTGEVDTEHSTNPVPFIVISPEYDRRGRSLPTGILADVGPTLLQLMNISKPQSVTGRNLLKFF